LAHLVGSRNLIAQINAERVAQGFRANDLGEAYAAWWLNSWLGSRGRTDDPPPRQIAAVRAQAARAIAALPQVAGADDATTPQMTEAYLVQTARISAHLEQARREPGSLRRLAAVV